MPQKNYFTLATQVKIHKKEIAINTNQAAFCVFTLKFRLTWDSFLNLNILIYCVKMSLTGKN